MVLGALIEKGYRATKISTTGGFLRHSNWMVLIGVEDDREVEAVLEVIRSHCHTRRQLVYPSEAPHTSEPIEVEVGGAIVFVWDVDRYERL